MKRANPNLQIVGGALLAMACGAAGAASVTVPYPYIDVVQQSGDLGVAATGANPTVTMQGTALAVVNGPGIVTSLSPTATFTLTATYNAALTAADNQPNTYDYGNGTIVIGNPGSPLLTATFSDLVMQSSGSTLAEFVIASSPLTYTGGSLAGNLPGGEIVGSFLISSAAATNASGYAVLSQDYTGNNLTAKVGAVVPLPASGWLLLAGIGALALIVRKRGSAVRAFTGCVA